MENVAFTYTIIDGNNIDNPRGEMKITYEGQIAFKMFKDNMLNHDEMQDILQSGFEAFRKHDEETFMTVWNVMQTRFQ